MKKSEISENFGEISEKVGIYRKLSEKVGNFREKSDKQNLSAFFFRGSPKNDISEKNRPKNPKFLSLAVTCKTNKKTTVEFRRPSDGKVRWRLFFDLMLKLNSFQH